MHAAAALAALLAALQSPLHLEPLVGGLDFPTAVAQPVGETALVFVAEQDGRVRIVAGGLIQHALLLDLRHQVFLSGQSGLLNLAFHPDYAHNGWIYAYFSTGPMRAKLVRYRVPVPASYLVDPASAETLVVCDASDSFHHGGGLDFGADGHVYLGVGDFRHETPGAACSAQDLRFLQGKILRVGDDGSIPSDNPFVSIPGAHPEIWAVGLRNPFRLAADRTTGALYVADVGELTREEIDVLPPDVAAGANLGWRIEEGTQCAASISCLVAACGSGHFLAPALDYDHAEGCCVIGGPVYRGQAIPELAGMLLYSDYCASFVRGLRLAHGAVQSVDLTAALDPGPGLALDSPTSFGVDGAGEPFLVDGSTAGPGTGEVYRILPPQPLGADRYALSVAGGGQQRLTLDVGPAHAGEIYLLLGTSSGTWPGTPAGPFALPLNLDPYFEYTLANPNSPPLSFSLGVLDASGTAWSSFQVPAGASAAAAGKALHHAFVAFDLHSGGAVSFASNAVPLWLQP